MIPKIIHYCWFGGNPLDKKSKKCIASWKKYCPDYEIVEWNENNFDINSNQYVKEAYEAKKWAFVTDYVRLYALYHVGGIYMDTDVEVIKKIDPFLSNVAFSGYESDGLISTAIMGSEKYGEWIQFLLNDYNDRRFLFENGAIDTTTNVITITKLTKEKYDIELDGKYIDLPGKVAFYPKEYFCPKSYETGKINKTKNTVCIHHFNASWMTDEQRSHVKSYGKSINRNRRKDKVDRIIHTPNRVLIKIMGNQIYERIKKYLKK